MRALIALLLLLACGCSSRAARVSSGPREPAALPPPAPAHSLDDGSGGICEIDPSACPRQRDGVVLAGREVKAEIYSSQSTSLKRTVSNLLSSAPGTTGSTPPNASLPSAGAAPKSQEMLDIEARFAVECESVATASARLRESVRAAGGTITLDQSELRYRAWEATLEIRVPVQSYDRFVLDLDGVGSVRTREVKVKDIAKEHHDSELLLSNLQAAMRRYEELLAKATTAQEVLAIERELERLRAHIDRVKSDLAWMNDRVARATIRVRLYSVPPEEAPLESRSSLYPSLRGIALFDLRGESEQYGYAGGGLGLAWRPESGTLRAIGVELDVARSAFTDRAPGSRYAYLALATLDLYSDLLGGGRRRFLNPYLGLRAGYTITGGSGDLALGTALGVDVWKARNAALGFAVRGLAMIGNDRGAHFAVGPELTFAFAF